MKFAIVDGKKAEASKGAKGICQGCGAELIAKCGEIKINHWAHKARRTCDLWWENETEWHRSWKGHFPAPWQEVIQRDEQSGEKHIADVLTQEGWVLEFQHSYLKPEERRSRNAFYPKLVWVVDGQRRKMDKVQFDKALKEATGKKLGVNYIYRVFYPENSRLLKEWLDCNGPVIFDFQESDSSEDMEVSWLWVLLPVRSNKSVFVMPWPKDVFIGLHQKNQFSFFVDEVVRGIQQNWIEQEQRVRLKMKLALAEMQRKVGRRRRGIRPKRRRRF